MSQKNSDLLFIVGGSLIVAIATVGWGYGVSQQADSIANIILWVGLGVTTFVWTFFKGGKAYGWLVILLGEVFLLLCGLVILQARAHGQDPNLFPIAAFVVTLFALPGVIAGLLLSWCATLVYRSLEPLQPGGGLLSKPLKQPAYD